MSQGNFKLLLLLHNFITRTSSDICKAPKETELISKLYYLLACDKEITVSEGGKM